MKSAEVPSKSSYCLTTKSYFSKPCEAEGLTCSNSGCAPSPEHFHLCSSIVAANPQGWPGPQGSPDSHLYTKTSSPPGSFLGCPQRPWPRPRPWGAPSGPAWPSKDFTLPV